jgi:Zn-dependent protease with chaperone function
MRINGPFGWVRHNDARSTALLLGFALLSQPLAMVVLFAPLVFLDPTHAPWYDWSGYATRYAPGVALAAACYFLVQMWQHVNSVRRDLAFRFVDETDEPRLCALLEPLAIAIGVRAPYVGVIESTAMNAFACGASRNFSVAVFTRGAIDGLDDDELSAVIAHELIHIRNGDTRLIAAANVFLRGLGLLDRVNVFKPRRYGQVAVVLLAPILFPVYLGVALLAQFLKRLGYASRLLISSAREFIADAQAVALTQNPSALVSALRKIQGNSAIVGLLPEQDAMMIDGAAQGALATHPTIGERIQAIVAATGTMALETRPRRDTRTDLERRRGEAGAVSSDGAASGPDQVRKLVRTALTRAAPAQGGVGAFLRSGANGEFGVFGMRWDIAAAMLATFLTATILHHGDILGFLGQMGHALDRPDANTKPLIDKALACRDAELKALAGGKPSPEACAMTEDVVAAAKKFGINVLPDGRVLTNGQLAMLSDDELEEAKTHAVGVNPGEFRSLNASNPSSSVQVVPIQPRVLRASYPLPLREAMRSLVDGDLGRFLQSQQCGVLVHAHVSVDGDRSVSWRITSEGEERIRYTVTLSPDGEDATRVALDISDRQPRFEFLEAREEGGGREGTEDDGAQQERRRSSAVFRPALDAPLRPAFVEAINAILEERLFRYGRQWNQDDWLPGDSTTAGLCDNQRNRLMMSGERFSIHDPVRFN